MINLKDTLELHVNTRLFFTFSYGGISKILTEIYSSTWNPPASIPSFFDSKPLIVVRRLLVRISDDDETELVSFETCTITRHSLLI